MGFREMAEEADVQELGDRIGYGRIMQLAEKIWNEKVPGGAHSVGPCVAFLVRCPHPQEAEDANGHCDLCCGSGRVTKLALKSFQLSFHS